MENDHLLVTAMTGGIWATASLVDEPEITLRGGKIMEVSSECFEGRTRHFYGYSIYGHEGRASTPILEWDPTTNTGKTKSGRTYRISNEKPRFSEAGDAQYVWNFMVHRDGMFDIIDVTEALIGEI